MSLEGHSEGTLRQDTFVTIQIWFGLCMVLYLKSWKNRQHTQSLDGGDDNDDDTSRYLYINLRRCVCMSVASFETFGSGSFGGPVVV